MKETSPRILFVEDEPPFRQFAGSFLQENGFQVRDVGTAGEALRVFGEVNPDLVLLDLNLPDLHGLEVLRRMRALSPEVRVMVLTSYDDANHAVKALKAGATDYLTKPVELDTLVSSARAALATESPVAATAAVEVANAEHTPVRSTARRSVAVKGQLRSEPLGAHPKWLEVVDRLDRVVESGLPTLLLLGESGTGKTALARRFHDLSRRRRGPFVEINCPSIPEALLESELFGYEKGAFTGATSRKRGQIELADHGTLFLDEIGDLPQGLQPKLLRFLEQRTFRRVGGLDNLEADVRLVCATNQNLRQAVEAGTFRRDLFYRLEVVSIELPALRDRGEDVILLAEVFLREFARSSGRAVPTLAADARRALLQHRFPGNVRELKNLIQRTVAFLRDKSEISAADLDLAGPRPAERSGGDDGALLQPVALETLLNAIEAHYVDLALARSASQREAAELLGLDRFSLARRRNRMERLGGKEAAQRSVQAAPTWVRELLESHPGDLPESGLTLGPLRTELEQRVIEHALRRTGKNRARAATLLGMSRTSLIRRLDARRS